jgi:hypothetical protein
VMMVVRVSRSVDPKIKPRKYRGVKDGHASHANT